VNGVHHKAVVWPGQEKRRHSGDEIKVFRWDICAFCRLGDSPVK
jgi:hypothetical protein